MEADRAVWMAVWFFWKVCDVGFMTRDGSSSDGVYGSFEFFRNTSWNVQKPGAFCKLFLALRTQVQSSSGERLVSEISRPSCWRVFSCFLQLCRYSMEILLLSWCLSLVNRTYQINPCLPTVLRYQLVLCLVNHIQQSLFEILPLWMCLFLLKIIVAAESLVQTSIRCIIHPWYYFRSMPIICWNWSAIERYTNERSGGSL